MYILLALIGFGVLIFVHEFGHFLAAKACGVKVLEFAIGMGPAIFKKQGKETLYSLRALPIGGYNAMEGEEEDSGTEGCFYTKPAWKKLIVLFAGSFMNLLLGFILIVCVFLPAQGFSSTAIESFFDGCPYEGENMLQVGDEFLKIDGRRVYFSSDIADALARTGSDTHDIVLRRDGKKVELKDFYMPKVEYPQEDGTTQLKYGFYFGLAENNFGNLMKYSWRETVYFGELVYRSLGDMISGAVSLNDMSGVVGIVDMVNTAGNEAETTTEGVENVVFMLALIAVNLGIMNLLPFPALDGGRIFAVIVVGVIEKISHKKVDPKYEKYIHAAGMILLLALMAVLVVVDVRRILLR